MGQATQKTVGNRLENARIERNLRHEGQDWVQCRSPTKGLQPLPTKGLTLESRRLVAQ